MSSEQAQLFAEQGWLVIPDFVSAEERAALLAQAEALVQGENRNDIIYYVYVGKNYWNDDVNLTSARCGL